MKLSPSSRNKNRGFEETNFTKSECGFQKTVFTEFREFSTESETYRAKVQFDSFKLKDAAKFRTNKNNNIKTWQDLDKIEVVPNNLVNLVSLFEPQP